MLLILFHYLTPRREINRGSSVIHGLRMTSVLRSAHERSPWSRLERAFLPANSSAAPRLRDTDRAASDGE